MSNSWDTRTNQLDDQWNALPTLPERIVRGAYRTSHDEKIAKLSALFVSDEKSTVYQFVVAGCYSLLCDPTLPEDCVQPVQELMDKAIEEGQSWTEQGWVFVLINPNLPDQPSNRPPAASVLLRLDAAWELFWAAHLMSWEGIQALRMLVDMDQAMQPQIGTLRGRTAFDMLWFMKIKGLASNQNRTEGLLVFTYWLVGEKAISYADAASLASRVLEKSINADAWAKRLIRWADKTGQAHLDRRGRPKQDDGLLVKLLKLGYKS